MIHYLYDGTVEVNFMGSSHRYFIDGEPKPGVTGILQVIAKEGLMLWPMNEALKYLIEHPEDFKGARRAYIDKSDYGKDIGTLVHAYIEAFFKGARPDVPMGCEAPVRAFHQWVDDKKPKIIESEKVVYSKTWDYAGTLDLLAIIDDTVNLIDFKTSNRTPTAKDGIYNEAWIQLGGYDLAYTEEYKDNTPRLHRVVNFAKKAGFYAEQTRPEVGLHANGFLGALGLYRALEKLKEKNYALDGQNDRRRA